MLFTRLLAVVEIQYANLWNSKLDHMRVAEVKIISRGIKRKLSKRDVYASIHY
jgi:hypothetical protein